MSKWVKYVLSALFFLIITTIFSHMPADQQYLEEQAVQELIARTVKTLENKEQRPLLANSKLVLVWENPSVKDIYSNYFNHKIEEHNSKIKASKQEIEIRTRLKTEGTVVHLNTQLVPSQGDLKVIALTKHLSSWVSVLPPLVAVTFALMTQRLVLSLFMGILIGSVIHFDYNILLGIWQVFRRYIFNALADDFHLQIFLFTASLLGMVSVINVGGGTKGVIDSLKKYTKNPRSTKIATAVMGLLVFFDDYANTMIVGSTIRPLTDKLKISREKLAYIVDSTAAPVSGIAIISTWIGYEVGLFQEVLTTLNAGIGGYEAFFMALPFRFYCILSLFLVFLVVLMSRDFGPMYQADKRAFQEGLVLRDGAVPLTSKTFNSIDAKEGIPCRWYNAVIPIIVVILATIAGLYVSGGGFAEIQQDFTKLWSFQVMRDSFSNANTGLVLSISAVLGSVVAILMLVIQRIMSPWESVKAWGSGLIAMMLAMIILTLAWAINNICKDLGTAPYLISIFKDIVAPLWIPVLIFVLSGAIAFATGSSWSTMAILIPTAIPLAYAIGGEQGLYLSIISMGAVLDGSIFGDHCSPLSDTTIMTSIACSCDHMDHVITQMPYALLAMVTATLIGYLPAAMGLVPYFSIGIGVLVMAIFLLIFGRNAELA